MCALVLLCAQTLGQLHHTIHISLATGKIHHSQHTAHSTQMQHEAHGDSESGDHEHDHDNDNDNDQGNDHDRHSAHNHDHHVQTPAAQTKSLANNQSFFAYFLSQLFDHDSGSENCRLIDGAASAGVSNYAVSAVYIAQAVIFLIAKSQVAATARAAELFEARGPPSATASL